MFGKVVEGMDVVNKIVAVPTGNQGGHQNVPRTPVTIESATLVSAKVKTPRCPAISDLHLTEERPEANERFIEFVEETARGAEALYILGDFFEYWIGDDDLEQPFNAVIAALLASLTRGGVRLYFMHGNRDFLVGDRFCAATGASLLPDPVVHEIPRRAHPARARRHLVHRRRGIPGVAAQGARPGIPGPIFLPKPLAERRRLILQMREKSKEVVQGKPAAIMDVNAQAVIEAAPPRRTPDPRPHAPAGTPSRRLGRRALGAARLVWARRLPRNQSTRPAPQRF